MVKRVIKGWVPDGWTQTVIAKYTADSIREQQLYHTKKKCQETYYWTGTRRCKITIIVEDI